MPCFIDEKIFNDLLTFFILLIFIQRVFGENETFMINIINNLNDRQINQLHPFFSISFIVHFHISFVGQS